jgi:hypothetical protein
MHADQGEWILNEGELAALATEVRAPRGEMDLLPPPETAGEESRRSVQDALAAMEPEVAALLRKAVALLASPARAVRLQLSAGDRWVSRTVLATSPEMPGTFVSLARMGELRRLSLRSEAEIRWTVARHLAAADVSAYDRVGADLSTPAVLALLAAGDQIRRIRLTALLRHEEGAELFSPESLAARLKEASKADFRWALHAAVGLLPLPVEGLYVARDPRPALVELARAGFLDAVSEAPTPLFEMTPPGRIFSEALANPGALAGLAVTRRAGQVLCHDVLFFCRGPFHLLGFLMSGEVGFASTLLGGDLDELLKFALTFELSAAPSRPAAAEDGDRTVLESPLPAPPAGSVVVEKGAGAGRRIALVPGLTAGRKEDNGLVVADPGASRVHLRFDLDGEGRWTVADLGSSNGTFVNETRTDSPAALAEGDRIRLGQTVLRFQATNG